MRMLPFILGICVAIASAQDLQITDVERSIDIISQLVKVNVAFTVNNAGKNDVNKVDFLLTEDENAHLGHIAATIQKKNARIAASGKPSGGFATFSIDLPNKLAAGASETITVNYILAEALAPFPEKIAQEDSQFVVYKGNAYFSAPYPVASQKTTVLFGSGGGAKLLSFANLAPSKQLGEKVVYGPYTNVAARAVAESRVHYENVSPFIVARSVDRLIELSHWGNIAVEEHIEIVHKGAALTGSFSRLDYQLDRRGRKQPCVKDFKTILPASARDIYYRDIIGNISSSAVKVKAESVEVEIKPRFPLFGGWKTNYVIGYNLPSYEYLHADGDKFALRMRLLDHIYDGMVVEKLTTRIVLPELASNIRVVTPYTVDRRPDGRMATYLDTVGRTVVILEKETLVDAHILPFTLTYTWQRYLIWREPLMASAFFFALFLAVIVYVRLDFQISKDPESEKRQGLAAKLNSVAGVLRSLMDTRHAVVAAVVKFKESRDEAAFDEAVKKAVSTRTSILNNFSSFIADMTSVAPAVAEKLTEIEKIESALSATEKSYVESTKKSTSKSSPEDKAWQARLAEATTKLDAIYTSL